MNEFNAGAVDSNTGHDGGIVAGGKRSVGARENFYDRLANFIYR